MHVYVVPSPCSGLNFSGQERRRQPLKHVCSVLFYMQNRIRKQIRETSFYLETNLPRKNYLIPIPSVPYYLTSKWMFLDSFCV